MGRIRRNRRPKFSGGRRVPWRAIRKHNKKRKHSSLELLVYAWLQEDGIPFKKEKAVGRCHIDIFLEPNICIELNGCYWHGCMICYKDLDHKQKIARVKDARRYAFLRSRKMDVVTFWECEIKKFPDRVRDQIRALARK